MSSQKINPRTGQFNLVGEGGATNWNDIVGKPSSTPANIDGAVSAKHDQNTDHILQALNSDFVDILGEATFTAGQTYSVYTPDLAHNGNINYQDGWIGEGTLPNWIKADFGVGNEKIITKARIISEIQDHTTRLKDYKIQGSNNNSDWTDLATVVYPNERVWQYVNFVNTTAYRYYRLYCMSNYNVEITNTIYIIEWELSEDTGIVDIINEGELINDLAVQNGITVDGRDISVDGTILDAVDAIKHTQNTDIDLKGTTDVVDSSVVTGGGLDNSHAWTGTTFTANATGLLTKASFVVEVLCNLPFRGNIDCELRTTDTGAVPSATILASQTISVVIDDYGYITVNVTFDTPALVNSGTTYFIDFHVPDPASLCFHKGSGSGFFFSADGSTWISGSNANAFEVYIEKATVIINNGTLSQHLRVAPGIKIGNSAIEDIDFVTKEKHRAPLVGKFEPTDLSSGGVLTVTHNWDILSWAVLVQVYLGSTTDTFLVNPASINCLRNSVVIDLSNIVTPWTAGYYMIQGEHYTIP